MDSLYTTIEVANEKGKLSAIIHAFTSIFWTFEFVPPLLRTLYSWSYGTDHIVFTGDKALDLAADLAANLAAHDNATDDDALCERNRLPPLPERSGGRPRAKREAVMNKDLRQT